MEGFNDVLTGLDCQNVACSASEHCHCTDAQDQTCGSCQKVEEFINSITPQSA